jgi:hypothetical protein
MSTSKPIILRHTRTFDLVTTQGYNLTQDRQDEPPRSGTGEFTIPTTLNAMAQRNENLIKLIVQLGLTLEHQ